MFFYHDSISAYSNFLFILPIYGDVVSFTFFITLFAYGATKPADQVRPSSPFSFFIVVAAHCYKIPQRAAHDYGCAATAPSFSIYQTYKLILLQINHFIPQSYVLIIKIIKFEIMDQRPYSPHQYRKIDNISQVSNFSANVIPLKSIDLICNIHTDEPCNNYCVENKCFQPLCSECIEGHLLHHKKNGYSDLSVKSMRGVRRQCVNKLSVLIDELLKRLGQLQAPPSPDKVLQLLEIKLQQAQKEAHEIIEIQFNRIKESLRNKINQSTTLLRSMADIHLKMENIIQLLKENCAILAQGKRGNLTVPESLKNTITLNEQGLLDSFEKESFAYQTRRKKVEFEVIFNPQQFRAGLGQALRITSPKVQNNNISEASFSRPKQKNNVIDDSNQWENSSINITLPVEAQPQQNNRLLHFFQTGSSRLHLIDVQNKKKQAKVVTIQEFIVPSFHASIVSSTGDFIYLSGGLVQLNGRSKSPLFMKYNIRTQVTKKDFAKVIPRSSHTLCQDKNGDIYILGGYGQAEREDESVYLNSVERVSQRTGKVEVEPDSRWGGSNIAFRCKDQIIKACEQGVEVYSPRQKQWATAQVKMKNINDYVFFKSAGFATISDSQALIFGGYHNNLQPADNCFFWKIITEAGRTFINIKELPSKLPTPEGFDNGKAVVDEKGCFALQNVEDDEQSCVDNERRLLRFDLKEGEWHLIQTISS